MDRCHAMLQETGNETFNGRKLLNKLNSSLLRYNKVLYTYNKVKTYKLIISKVKSKIVNYRNKKTPSENIVFNKKLLKN